MSRDIKPFWIEVDIHEGSMDDTVKDLKELLLTVRKDFLMESQKVLSKNIGFNEDSIRKYEELKDKPYVGISLLKKICQAYGLNCKIKLYKNDTN